MTSNAWTTVVGVTAACSYPLGLNSCLLYADVEVPPPLMIASLCFAVCPQEAMARTQQVATRWQHMGSMDPAHPQA
jgi:hypothetical protein